MRSSGEICEDLEFFKFRDVCSGHVTCADKNFGVFPGLSDLILSTSS